MATNLPTMPPILPADDGKVPLGKMEPFQCGFMGQLVATYLPAMPPVLQVNDKRFQPCGNLDRLLHI